MYSTGSTTRNTFRYGPEVHKLHLEFQVKSGEVVHKGQPVILDTEGGIAVVAPAPDTGASALQIIGVSIHEGQSAYGDRVVIAMRAYTVIEAQASADVTPGPVMYSGYLDPAVTDKPDIADDERETNTTATQGLSLFANIAGSGDEHLAIGWSLTNAATDAMILVAIMD